MAKRRATVGVGDAIWHLRSRLECRWDGKRALYRSGGGGGGVLPCGGAAGRLEPRWPWWGEIWGDLGCARQADRREGRSVERRHEGRSREGETSEETYTILGLIPLTVWAVQYSTVPYAHARIVYSTEGPNSYSYEYRLT